RVRPPPGQAGRRRHDPRVARCGTRWILWYTGSGMTPDEPPGSPSEGIPRSESGPGSGAVSTRTRRDTWLGENAPSRRFLARWGFPLFIVFLAILGRSVLLPFVFAFLIAYILAPVVRWMSERD